MSMIPNPYEPMFALSLGALTAIVVVSFCAGFMTAIAIAFNYKPRTKK